MSSSKLETYVYLSKAGEKYAIFHRKGRYSWEHPYTKKAKKVCEGCG